MIKTTLTKLKKAYSTLSFAPRALGLESNGKFYKLIFSLMRRADKRTNPDKTEEEEFERGEVLAKLILTPSDTAALFSKGLSKPEALQKSSFLAPPADNNQREKSTYSKKDDSKRNDLNNPECNLPEVTESMLKPVPHSLIQPYTNVNKVPQSDTETHRQEKVFGETHRQEKVFGETKNIDPPNSLQNAIPDIILDKDNFDDCPDEKNTRPKVLCGFGKENSNGNTFKNLENNFGPVKVNDILQIKSPPNSLCDGENGSPSIKFFASYDKTRKPPSTETNSNFDELAKHCLDSPNNKIDERLLKEMKKLGVPQTSPRSENSVIEENIIQMDVLRKPRKPAQKTEIDVETRKFEHPPLNYSDEQRLEFEPSTAEEEEDLPAAIQKNKKDTSVLASQFCNVRPPLVDGDEPLLNPFDKRNIKLDDDNDVDDAKNYYNIKAPGANAGGNANFAAINKPKNEPKNEQESTIQSEGIADQVTISLTPIEKSNTVDYQLKAKMDLFKQSENNGDNVTMNYTPIKKSDTVDNQPKDAQDMSIQSEKKADNVTMNFTPLKNTPLQKTLYYQPEGEMDWSKLSRKDADNVTVNYTPVNQHTVNNFKIADETHVLSKLSEDKGHTATVNSTPLLHKNGVHFQAEGELAYSSTGILEQSKKKAQKTVNREPKRHNLEHSFYDHVPKIPEPLLVFNPPEQESAKMSVQTNQIDLPRANEDPGTDHHVAFVQNLKSLRIRCNMLPTNNTDEKATISLLVEIDAIKQPREELTARHQPDVTYREDSADQQHEKQSIPYLKKIDHITRDKVTLILPAKEGKTYEAQTESLPKEKSEIPLSEMLKRVRSRNRAEYCHQLQKNLEYQLNNGVETVTGKCGDKPSACPPRCPPPQKSRCPPPATPPSGRPACPRPCRPSAPPCCPPPCPKPCGPSHASKAAGNPCCPGSGSGKKGGNPCCPGSGSDKKGGNPCCPGAGSPNKRGNPCKFSMHLPTIMMYSIVSLIHQRVTIAESELAQNQFFMVTKDAYQRFLNSACFGELYRPRLLPIFNICGFDSSLDNYESMNSMLARDYAPWVPIPCWPVPKKEAKKPVCPKGCPIPLPGKNRPPCDQNPCRGFPKRKNSFSIIDLYACWSNPNSIQ